jgi:iron complex outermembrane receptor protein
VTIAGSPSFVQAAGDPIPNASKWNVTLAANYTKPISDNLQIDANANYLYRSEFYTNGVDPNTRVRGYGITNVNIGIGAENGSWRVGLFARNLFNTYYISAVEAGFADAGALLNVLNPDAKRTVGIVLDSKF